MEELARLLNEHGLLLVFVNVFLTQAGVPVPAVPMLVMAGAYAGAGHYTVAAVVLVAVIASLIGDLPWYLAGRRYGYRILGYLCRMAVEPASCVERTEDRLSRYGPSSLMFAKFIPGFATVAPPLAGASRLPLIQFLFFSAIGAALWSGAAVAAGTLFRREVEAVVEWIELAGMRAAGVMATLLALYIAVKWMQRYRFMHMLRMARITVHELAAMMGGEPRPLILDARAASARRADPRRIPGAVPVDIHAPERAVEQMPADRDVVVYCT